MSVRVAIGSSHRAPRLAQAIEKEPWRRLADLRCPEHDQPALAQLTIADDGAVQIAPVACCDQLNRLVLALLRESPTLEPPCDPEHLPPGEPR